MPQTCLEVERVMGRSHFHDAGAKLTVDISIFYYRNFSTNQGKKSFPPIEPGEPLIVGMDCQRGISQHGLRSGGGNNHIFIGSYDRILYIIEFALHIHMVHLQVGDS